MPYVNSCFFMGHAAREAETKFTSGGIAHSRFTLAVSKRWKDKQSDEWKEQTSWIPVVAWRQEKACERITKGKLVLVEGSIETREYEKDGQKRTAWEVVADSVKPIDTMPRENRGETQARPVNAGAIDDSDVPF